MMENSRKRFVLKNSIFGLILQCIVLISNLLIRWAIINWFNEAYLGLTSLFNSIVTVLSISELGFGIAMLYSLYKPISDSDYEKIKALVGFFKKVYVVVSLVILVLGLALMPFLGFIVKLDEPIEGIPLYYLLYLFSTISTYLLVYKRVLISANQKDYVIRIISIIAEIIKLSASLVAIIVFKSFLAYLFIYMGANILISVLCGIKADKDYPFIKEKTNNLDKETKGEISKSVRSLFFFRFFSVLVSNADYIIISTMIGTVFVGYFSNYQLIVTALLGFTQIIYNSIIASLGNYNLKHQKDTGLFFKIQYMYFIVFGVFSICIYALANDFVFLLSSGNTDYILEDNTVLMIVINFLVQGLLGVIHLYRDATGLFKKTYPIAIAFCILNIVLSIVLGFQWGMFGIIFATLISRLCTNFSFEPIILFKSIFDKKPTRFYIRVLYQILIAVGLMFLAKYISGMFFINPNWGFFLLKCVIFFVVSSIVVLLFSLMMFKDFKYFIELVKKFIFKKRDKTAL